jgi:Tfp pilus assembly protein PilF
VRKKLAQLALAQGDAPAAARWALDALHISVVDPELHAWRAEALGIQGQASQAAHEYAMAIEIEPDDPKLRLSLAQMYVKANEPAKAKTALEELLKRDPDQADAAELLEKLK